MSKKLMNKHNAEMKRQMDEIWNEGGVHSPNRYTRWNVCPIVGKLVPSAGLKAFIERKPKISVDRRY